LRTMVPAVVPDWPCPRGANRASEEYRRALDDLWSEAFNVGRLAALGELAERFCVGMK
jgi:hypothetical protein